MKNRLIKIGTIASIILLSIGLNAQRNRRFELSNTYPVRDSISRGDFTLIFLSNDKSFDPLTKSKMIETFFTVYPLEAKRWNRNTLTKVVFIVDTLYKGVAETGGGVARYNPVWMKNHPNDIDVVTHEVMHIVQNYKGFGPGWLTEGIADYARYVYGIHNISGNWTLPPYTPKQSYTDAYRVTARFLVWVEKNHNVRLVDTLDAAMRKGIYAPEMWVELTGKTVDDLWKDYAKNPVVSLIYK